MVRNESRPPLARRAARTIMAHPEGGIDLGGDRHLIKGVRTPPHPRATNDQA